MRDKRNGLFDIGIRRLARQMLPHQLRRPLLWRLVAAGVGPLERLAGSLRRLRGECWEELGRSGQVWSLERLLNDEFDEFERRIRIQDANVVESLTLSGPLPRRVAGVGRIIGPRGGEGASAIVGERGAGRNGNSASDFLVELPGELSGLVSDRRIRGLINRYKLPGMRWRAIVRVG